MYALTQIKSIIKSGVPLLIEGPTGTGKTYTIMELAKEQGKTLHVINVSGELTVDMLLGRDTLKDGNVNYVKAKFIHALTNGDWLLMDELNTALPEVLTVLNGVLDDSRSVTLADADNTRVTAHEDFRFIGTQNPASGNYVGTGRMNEALLNRMVKVTMGYLEFDAEVEALRKHTSLKDSSIVQLVKLADFTRRRMDDHLSTRDLVKILRLREAGGMNLKDAIETVVLSRFSRDDYAKLYDYHSTVMRELREIGSEDKDPFETIKEKLIEIRKREEEIEIEKRDVRSAVRSEILKDLISGKVGA